MPGVNSSSSSVALKTEYEPAPFKASRISQSVVRLIKVPQFVADCWRNAEDNTIVAVSRRSREGVEELLLNSSDDPNNALGGITKLTARSVNPSPGLHVLAFSGEGKQSADVAAVVGESITFTSDWSGSYRNLLRQRHQKRDITKVRGTVEENRPEAGFDDRTTLFQYYQKTSDKDAMAVEEPRKTTTAPSSSRPKSKGRKQATLTEDELKIRLFSMFEEAGEEGLMIKQIVVATGQPQCFVKSVVDEIAEPGRRKSDKRTVLFVKSQFNPNAVLPDEPTKKQRIK
eukprot:GHVS01090221.1.p1 GENE.GHVS01090221.1~~GHVS01090221.1.p1  ORF type:complete len:286 (+),score=34.18 GHVS01090221.1:320-1177(+)